jgi:hypothetical protein
MLSLKGSDDGLLQLKSAITLDIVHCLVCLLKNVSETGCPRRQDKVWREGCLLEWVSFTELVSITER